MPKESSKTEARKCAMMKIMNPNVNSVEITIESTKIEVTVAYYDGSTEQFRWYD